MNQDGQVLVSILIIIAVSVLATGTAVVASSLSKTTGISTTSDKLLYAAESGVDESLIKLLRNPTIYNGETLILEGVSVNVVVNRLPPTKIIITSEAVQDSFRRKVEVSAEFVNNILTVTSWKQVL